MVKQDGDVGVVDNRFLDNRTADNVLQLLRNDTNHSPEFSGCLIQIFDVLCHHGGGHGFPCLFYDKHLAVLLDTHLLDEHIHDDKGYKREEGLVVLDGVYLEDDEGLVKQ